MKEPLVQIKSAIIPQTKMITKKMYHEAYPDELVPRIVYVVFLRTSGCTKVGAGLAKYLVDKYEHINYVLNQDCEETIEPINEVTDNDETSDSERNLSKGGRPKRSSVRK